MSKSTSSRSTRKRNRDVLSEDDKFDKPKTSRNVYIDDANMATQGSSRTPSKKAKPKTRKAKVTKKALETFEQSVEEQDIVDLAGEDQDKEFLTENSESEEEGEIRNVRSKVVAVNNNATISAPMPNSDTYQTSRSFDDDTGSEVTFNFNRNQTIMSEHRPANDTRQSIAEQPSVTDELNVNWDTIEAYHMCKAQKIEDVDERVKQQIIGETVAKTMRQLMSEGRLVMEKETTPAPHRFNKGSTRKGNQQGEHAQSISSQSELTIYDNAVQQMRECVINQQAGSGKRDSSSSEEGAIDTSDETITSLEENDIQQELAVNVVAVNDIPTIITGQRRAENRRPSFVDDGMQPSTSGQQRNSNPEPITPEQFTNNKI